MATITVEGSRYCNTLFIGLLCTDHKYVVSSFPFENSQTKSISYSRTRGGNASTNSIIMSQLGWKHVEFYGSIGDNIDTQFCLTELSLFGVSSLNCVKRHNFNLPNTCAIINKQKGSRTLVHHRGVFPELAFNEFSKLDLTNYKLIHFEGRPNICEISRMISHIVKWNENVSNQIFISFEMEKARDFVDICSRIDVLFLGKDYAISLGFNDMQTTIQNIIEKCKFGCIVICAWGTKGACGCIRKKDNFEPSDLVFSECFPPSGDVKDTLGAGDTFVASCLYAIFSSSYKDFSRNTLSKVLEFACKIAGYKCGIYGFDLHNCSMKQICDVLFK